MFRITRDHHFNHWYIHKKFLFWWVKLGYPKSNVVSSINHVQSVMKNGTLNFNFGEYCNYYYVVDREYCTIEYFNDIEEFIHKYAEYLI